MSPRVVADEFDGSIMAFCSAASAWRSRNRRKTIHFRAPDSAVVRTSVRGRQGFLELWLQRDFQIVGGDRPDQLVGNAAVAIDHERLGYAVHAPVDRGAAVGVSADR